MSRPRQTALALLILALLVGCDPGGGAVVAPAPDEEGASASGDPARKKGRKAVSKATIKRQPTTALGRD